MMCGGTGDLKDADADIQTLADSVRADFESKTEKSYSMFKAVSYKSQVVAGTNYFIKVQIEEGGFAHLRVFKPLPHQEANPELHSYQVDKNEADDVDYF